MLGRYFDGEFQTMIRKVLSFILLSPEKLSEKKAKEWEKEHHALLESLGATLEDYVTTIEATRSNVAQLVKLLQQWRKEGARINGYGYGEELVDEEPTPVEWFTVRRSSSDHEAFENEWEKLERPIQTLDDYISVRADRLKPNVHVVDSVLQVYVSERFKAVVEAHRLSGIEFIWIRDIGKYRAPQWYLPVCSQCLGRGLDAPWIDPSKLSGKGNQTLDPRGRHGVVGADPEQYKRDAGPDDPGVQKLLRLLRSMELLKRPPELEAVPRFLRKYVPNTDFAGTILDMAEYYDDIVHRHRGLAMNRKAYDLLKTEGIVADEECMPVLIVERAPPGVENLDRRYGPPEPAFSPEQMARIRDLESRAWAEHVANPKPPRAPDLARALGLLRSAKRRAPKHFAKPAAQKAIDEAAHALGMAIPTAWQKVLSISNGGQIDDCPLAEGYACRITPTQKLAKECRAELAFYREIGAELPDSLVEVMTTEFGDSIWLDTSRPCGSGDCRVVLMSHETAEEHREWSSIAEFLEEMLTFTANQ
jgi:hypothetical protein